MTNAYACRPCSRETRVVQTSPVVARASGVAFGSQPLKSPTSDTRVAPGARNTNVTAVDSPVNVAIDRGGAGAPRDAIHRAPAHAPITSTASRLAAKTSGRTLSTSGSTHQAPMRERRALASRRSRAMARSRACASPSIGRWYASRTSSSHRSSGFIALHFLPPRPDMVPGALHTHLERRDAGSRDPRDLLVFEPVTE